MKTEKNEEKRKKLIKLIHVGKSKLHLSENNYRALLISLTDKRSCKDMNLMELAVVYKAIKNLGFQPERKMTLKAKEVGRATPEQLDYIKALWELSARVKTEGALNSFIKRITGVPFLRWLDVKSAQKVILAVRDIATKAGYDPDKFLIKAPNINDKES